MVMNIPLPEITQTHKEWQRSGEQILKLYQDCRFFRPMPGEVPEDRQLAGLRVSCMRSLSPILSAPREGARSSAYAYLHHPLPHPRPSIPHVRFMQTYDCECPCCGSYSGAASSNNPPAAEDSGNARSRIWDCHLPLSYSANT